MSNESPSAPTKAKPKFTILDDLDELNEIINGPGANEDNLKTQQILQKTYNFMKGEDEQHRSRNAAVAKSSDLDTQNACIFNIVESKPTLDQLLDAIKPPRITVSFRTIDLQAETAPEHRRIFSLFNESDPYRQARAPNNSLIDCGENELLFTKALHRDKDMQASNNTDRNEHKAAAKNFSSFKQIKR